MPVITMDPMPPLPPLPPARRRRPMSVEEVIFGPVLTILVPIGLIVAILLAFS